MTYRAGRAKAPPLAKIFFALMAVAVFACGEATPTLTPTPPPFPFTLIDSNGNQVTLDNPPERIVAIDSATVEILFAIGEGHRVAGTHEFASYPPETADIEKVGNAFALDFERIAALEPDLINIIFDQFVPQLENLGAPVLYLKSPETLEEVAQRFRAWGEIVNKPSAGEEMAQQFEQSIEKAKGRVASVKDGPRVFFLGDPTLWTSGSGTLIQEIFTALKVENIFEDVGGFAQVSPEEIVARDPQIIIGVYSVGPDPTEVMEDNPAFQQLSAVKEGKIFRGDNDLLGTAGPRLIQGIEQLAAFLYPELFP